MKYCIVLIMMAIVSDTLALADSNIQSNQNLITSTVQSIGEKAFKDFQNSAPILGILETSQDFRILCTNSETTWSQSLSNLSKSHSNRNDRLVLLHSFLYLSPKEYMKCLTQVLELYKKGIIQRDEIVFIYIFPPRDENRWFLSYNVNEPDMIKFLGHVREVFEQDKDVTQFIDFIANGKARSRDERLRNETPSSLKRKIPLLTQP